jgi:dihydrofolate reductase
VLPGDVAKEVTELKRQIDGDIVVYGSIRLVRALVTGGLVDELRLTVFPTVLGDGERLFAGTSAPVSLRLVGSRPIGASLLQLSYAATPAS